MRAAVALVTVLAFAASESLNSRVTHGTNIRNYAYVAALLRSPNSANYRHACAGSIINNRSVLTAARCLRNDAPGRWRFRVGANMHNSGGTGVYSVTRIALHSFDERAMTNDIAVIRTNQNITFGTFTRAGRFAGAYYNLADNRIVVAVGWGFNGMPQWQSAAHTNLRSHIQHTIAGDTCRTHYAAQGFQIRDQTQLCSGFNNPGSVNPFEARDKCLGEPGAPLIHGDTIVGVRSFALSCNNAAVPTINSRVGHYVSWIASQA